MKSNERKKRKRFLFEKKKQKTFVPRHAGSARAIAVSRLAAAHNTPHLAASRTTQRRFIA
jgi:hypothetical protein